MRQVETADYTANLLGFKRDGLRSIQDVIPAQVHIFTDSLASLTSQYGLVMLHAKAGSSLPADTISTIQERLKAVRVFAEECQLTQSKQRCDHILWILQKYPDRADFVKTAIQGLLESFSYEINEKRFLYLDPTEVDLYLATPDEYFTSKVCKRFPDMRYDSFEALGCLALNRGTACVFHVHRAMEICIRGVWRSLYHPPNSDKVLEGGLGKYLGDVRSFLKDNQGQRKFPDWTDREKFYDEIGYYLPGVKVVRNQTAHPIEKYTVEEAKAAVVAARAIMIHVASRITQTGLYKPI